MGNKVEGREGKIGRGREGGVKGRRKVGRGREGDINDGREREGRYRDVSLLWVVMVRRGGERWEGR